MTQVCSLYITAFIHTAMLFLCRIHYVEYLVGLINQNMIDPAETFTPGELTIVLQRNDIAVPQRPQGQPEELYRQKLLAVSELFISLLQTQYVMLSSKVSLNSKKIKNLVLNFIV